MWVGVVRGGEETNRVVSAEDAGSKAGIHLDQSSCGEPGNSNTTTPSPPRDVVV